jgi:hypothetical protein
MIRLYAVATLREQYDDMRNRGVNVINALEIMSNMYGIDVKRLAELLKEDMNGESDL